MTHQNTDTWYIMKLRNPDPGAGTDACSKPGTIGITEDGRHFIYTGVSTLPWVQVTGVPGVAMGAPFIVSVPVRTVTAGGTWSFLLPPGSLPPGAVAANVVGVMVVLDITIDAAVDTVVKIDGVGCTLGGAAITISIAAPGGAGTNSGSAYDGNNRLEPGDALQGVITTTNTLPGGATIFFALVPVYL